MGPLSRTLTLHLWKIILHQICSLLPCPYGGFPDPIRHNKIRNLTAHLLSEEHATIDSLMSGYKTVLHPTALLHPLLAIEGAKTKRKEPASNWLEMLSTHPSPPSCFQLPEEWVKLPPLPTSTLLTGWRQSGDSPTVKLLDGYVVPYPSPSSIPQYSTASGEPACSSKGHAISIPSSIDWCIVNLGSFWPKL